MQYESLIFDIDGTLWDSRALVALQGIFPTHGLNPHLLLWQADSLTEPLGKSLHIHNILFNLYIMDEAISRMFYG